jgi:hypothetical protein
VAKAIPRVLATRLALVFGVGSIGATEARAQEDAGATRAEMRCEKAAGAGRVRCEVEARVPAGESIAWGDVAIVKLPPFAVALRGRVGPHDAAVREPGLWRWTFAVLARDKGTGEVEGHVRVVVCPAGGVPDSGGSAGAAGACGAREVDVVGKVEVGP